MLDDIVRNVLRETEHDPNALAIETRIKNSLQNKFNCSGYATLSNSPENKVENDRIYNTLSDREMLLRHGYTLTSGDVYYYYGYITFQKGSHCSSDKRMMSADEMYTFYEELLEIHRIQHENYMIGSAQKTFIGPSLSTVENGNYITKEYCFGCATHLPYHLKVVEDIKGRFPNIQSETNHTKRIITLMIPKEYTM